MNAQTATVPAVERSYTVRFTPELLIVLAAGVLALVVLAFFLGSSAEQTHQRMWGPRKTSEAPGLGRPEPLPDVQLATNR